MKNQIIVLILVFFLLPVVVASAERSHFSQVKETGVLLFAGDDDFAPSKLKLHL